MAFRTPRGNLTLLNGIITNTVKIINAEVLGNVWNHYKERLKSVIRENDWHFEKLWVVRNVSSPSIFDDIHYLKMCDAVSGQPVALFPVNCRKITFSEFSRTSLMHSYNFLEE